MNALSREEQIRVALEFCEEKGLPKKEGLKLLDGGLRHPLVGVEEFLFSEDYMDAKGHLYPKVVDTLIELNKGRYIEAVLTGAIGTAKTTIALYSQAFQLYKLSCHVNPHAMFDLDPSSEIVVIFQSITEKLAKAVDYARFQDMIRRSKYFRKYFPYDKDIKSEMQFPNRIIVKPVAGNDTAAIGQNVIGGMIDEVNFMSVVEKSLRSHDGTAYDQAEALYLSIARRRESRFLKGGELPGMLCLVSSKRYPGEFTDRKIEEAKSNPGIYVYDKRVWEVKPEGTYLGPTFRVFCGDETRKPRVLEDDEEPLESEKPRVMDVPIEHRHQFEADILQSLRDIAGVNTFGLHPFILDKDKIAACFGRTRSILSREEVDFVETKLKILSKRIPLIRPELKRAVHIDLSISSDFTGIACGYVPEFAEMEKGNGHVELMPRIVYDFVLAIRPPKNGEINYEKIRHLIYMLRDKGLNIEYVTMDSFQSTDMLQQLRTQGFKTAQRSLDKEAFPYELFKSAIMQGRIRAPMHERARREIMRLERDPKTGKIDHPPQGSKDCADAMAGVCHTLTMQRATWIDHQIPPHDIPLYLQIRREQEAKEKKSLAAQEERLVHV